MTTIFLKVLELSLVGCYVTLLVLAARVLIRKSPKWCSYLLWSAVFLRLILPVVPESNFSLVPSGMQLPAEVVSKMEQPVVNMQPAGRDNLYVPGTRDTNESNQVNIAQNASGGENGALDVKDDIQSAKTPETPGEANKGLDKGVLLRTLAYIWLAGVVLFGGYHFVTYHKFKRSLQGAVKVESGVYEIAGKHVSFVMGVLRPAIYLSDSLDAETRKVVLCHEQVHLQRRDYLIKPAALAICCVHWFNPLVWLAFYLLNRDCEMSCDERVVALLGEESKKLYSYALLDEAAGGVRARGRQNACAVLSFGEESIKSRIKHVLGYKKASKWLVGGTVVGLVLLMVALCSNNSGADVTTGTEQGDTYAGAESQQETVVVVEPELMQFSPQVALESWAYAFCDKSGQALYELSGDKDAFEAWDMVTELEKGFAFGDSSPWPNAYDFEIDYVYGQEYANIRYWMRNSAPEVYAADERVRVTKREAYYYVDHVEMTYHSEINTLEELMKAYVTQDKSMLNYDRLSKETNRLYWWTKFTGYDKSDIRAIRNHIAKGTNPEYYGAYKDPVTAAKRLLNLGDGTGEVTEYLHVVLPQVLISSGLGEGTVVNVSYTFAEDGSKVQIPMVLADESTGLWALSAGDFTKDYKYEGETLPADEEFLARKVYSVAEFTGGREVQITDFGVYLLTMEDLENIYPSSRCAEEQFCCSYDAGKVYFPAASDYHEGDLEIAYDSICEMDVNTGKWRYVPFLFAGYIPEGTSLSVHSGYLEMRGAKEGVWVYPDAGPVWQGKTSVKLNDAEKQAYAASNREHLLAHPGEFVALGSRYEALTETYVDLDGDGGAEHIMLSGGPGQGMYYPYDSYALLLNGTPDYGTGERLHNEIYAVSPDGEDIYIVLYQEGPSWDPLTTFFKYKDGLLTEAGQVESYLDGIEFVNGKLQAVAQVQFTTKSYRIGQYQFMDDGNLAEMMTEVYDLHFYDGIENVKLLKELTLYKTLYGTESFVVQPQEVVFTQVTADGRWVCLRALDGSQGWFEVTGPQKIYGQPDSDWFELLHAKG